MKSNSYKIPKELEAKEKKYELSQQFGISFVIILVAATLYFEGLISLTLFITIAILLVIVLIIHKIYLKNRRIF